MWKYSMWKPETNYKTLPTRLSSMEGCRKKYNIQGDIRTLLGEGCELEKIMKFLREIGIFKKIHENKEISKLTVESYSY